MGFASNLVVLMAFLGAFVCSHTVFTILLHPHVHLDRSQEITRPARISLRHLRRWRRAFDHQSATFKSFLSTSSHHHHHQDSSASTLHSSTSSHSSSSSTPQGRPDPAITAHSSSSSTVSDSASTSASSLAASSSASSSSSTLLPVLLRPKTAGKASGAASARSRRFHTVVTGDSSVYIKWQSRVMYFHFKKQQAAPGGEHMGGFTRLLHTGVPDDLMLEIPTFVVDPLPPHMQTDFVVLNRPYAFLQWIQKATIEEDYVYMAEPDHLIVRPIPNLASPRLPSAFHFTYISPQANEAVLRKWYSKERGPISNIDPIGNSPVIIHKLQLARIAPVWHNVSVELKNDKEADKAFGWVLEMYGYALASALVGVQHSLLKTWMIQPPWEPEIGDCFLIHFTYGQDITLDGKVLPGKVGPWHFDKRDFSAKYPPRNVTYPPPNSPPSVVLLIRMINEATWSIPDWPGR